MTSGIWQIPETKRGGKRLKSMVGATDDSS